MKRFLCLLVALLAMLSFSACQKQDKTDPSDTSDNGDPAEKTYTFVIESLEIAVDAPADELLAALGAPKDYSESPSCAFSGLDKVYIYSGFRVQTYPLNGKDYIHSIAITDDSVATRKGISIGATREQVLAAYPSPDEQSETSLIYHSKSRNMSLQFILRDQAVTNIQYLKSE